MQANHGAGPAMPIDKFISEEDVQRRMKLLQKHPLSENDVRRERCHSLATFLESVHDACYLQCGVNNGYTFLSVKEGKCFRNCITKVAYHQPALRESAQESAYIFQNLENDELRAKLGRPNPDLRII